ncbi:MAG: hypothetical protein MUF33_04345 [Candidatus Nanopelagicales bacterium]|nr:hypothetical protein [Candidatus Nanopelagicales bacterium]
MSLSFLPRPDVDPVVRETRAAFRSLQGGGFADLRRMPSEVIFDEPKCTVHRYEPTADQPQDALPVLLIPPMAATPVCFDLRRGCSMVEFLLDEGRPTYLVDYGDISTLRDQDLGLEHWIDAVLPDAIESVLADSGARGVHLVGWCLGGILEMFTAAAHPELPIMSVTSVASPFDFSSVRVLGPVRLMEDLTGGLLTTGLVRTLGGIPGRLNGLIYRWLDPVKQIKKPLTQLQSRSDPDTLAQIEAVDVLMDTMEAYPGRSISQIYHSLIRTNRFSEGRLVLKHGRTVELSDVTVPVMAIAGAGDLFFAPPASAHHVGTLLTNSPEVRLERAPGGHLGVLTGRGARDTTWKYIDGFLRDNDRQR